MPAVIAVSEPGAEWVDVRRAVKLERRRADVLFEFLLFAAVATLTHLKKHAADDESDEDEGANDDANDGADGEGHAVAALGRVFGGGGGVDDCWCCRGKDCVV